MQHAHTFNFAVAICMFLCFILCLYLRSWTWSCTRSPWLKDEQPQHTKKAMDEIKIRKKEEEEWIKVLFFSCKWTIITTRTTITMRANYAFMTNHFYNLYFIRHIRTHTHPNSYLYIYQELQLHIHVAGTSTHWFDARSSRFDAENA